MLDGAKSFFDNLVLSFNDSNMGSRWGTLYVGTEGSDVISIKFITPSPL